MTSQAYLGLLVGAVSLATLQSAVADAVPFQVETRYHHSVVDLYQSPTYLVTRSSFEQKSEPGKIEEVYSTMNFAQSVILILTAMIKILDLRLGLGGIWFSGDVTTKRSPWLFAGRNFIAQGKTTMSGLHSSRRPFPKTSSAVMRYLIFSAVAVLTCNFGNTWCNCYSRQKIVSRA